MVVTPIVNLMRSGIDGINDSLQSHPWLMGGAVVKNCSYRIVEKNQSLNDPDGLENYGSPWLLAVCCFLFSIFWESLFFPLFSQWTFEAVIYCWAMGQWEGTTSDLCTSSLNAFLTSSRSPLWAILGLQN